MANGPGFGKRFRSVCVLLDFSSSSPSFEVHKKGDERRSQRVVQLILFQIVISGLYRFAMAAILLFIGFLVLDAAIELTLQHGNESVPSAAKASRRTR